MNIRQTKKYGLIFAMTVTTWLGGSVRALETAETVPSAEDCATVTDDGAWCWFSDPRAIYVDGVIIGGFVDKEGSIWAFSYDPSNGRKKQTKLYDKLDYDDHANPSFMVLPDKRVVSFFSSHGRTKFIGYTITKKPADISEWEDVQKITPEIEGRLGVCYTNPAQLSGENNRIYVLFRGANFKPCYVYTDDLKTWSKGDTLIRYEDSSKRGRPYLKTSNNGKDKMFLAFTDGHPRDEPLNSIYFALYKDGKLWKVDGEEIGALSNGPVSPDKCDLVYDAKKTHDKSWIWDVAYDEKEYPVIVYARFSKETGEHSYWYARWDGKNWLNRKITNAGRWFQRNDYPKEVMERECNYSGGVYLDHQNPNIVYTSRPINDRFEIEKWETKDLGKTWNTTPVTSGSEKDNVRPFVIRGESDGKPNVLWMYNHSYPNFRAYDTAIRVNDKRQVAPASLKEEDVKAVARKVADWQIGYYPDQGSTRSPDSWRNGVLYVGMADWAESSGDKKYDNWLQGVFNRMSWLPGARLANADDICVGQAYLDLYAKHGKERMKRPTQARLDSLIEHRDADSDGKVPEGSPRRILWHWCDALFMAPPVHARLYAQTGEKKYMDFAHREFKATYDLLFDKDEHLFFRDASFLKKKESNGKKVFWSRGNAWVVGGLAEILKALPKDDTVYRPYYEKLFVEMCTRLAGLQQEDGFWHPSLLDPAAYPFPETSGTGLMVYAFAYGINAGLLPRDQYLPAIQKGWNALVSSVNTEGRLGWVQSVAAKPGKVERNSTEVYGTGAFLMAACEICKLAD